MQTKRMTTHTICFREAAVGPADAPIFRHFDWIVEPYQAWVVTGSNGSGKSAVLEAAGVKNVLTKSMGSNNHIAVVHATLDGLMQLRLAEQIQNIRKTS